MPFEWSFLTKGASIIGQLACWPIEPGSLRIEAGGKVLTDNGDGTLSGDGTGFVAYGYGKVGFDFDLPALPSGTKIYADYSPVEGGCVTDCGKCATHYIQLDITPDTISGSDEFTMQDAWARLLEKIKRDVKPIHVELMTDSYAEHFNVSVGHRFDIIGADEEPLDSDGLRTYFDDTSW
jgi:hypothetical protein